MKNRDERNKKKYFYKLTKRPVWLVLGGVGVLMFGYWFYYLFQPIEGIVEKQFQRIFFNGFFTALSFGTNVVLAIYGLKRYFDQEKKEGKQSTSQYLSNMNISYIENKDFTEIYRNLEIVYHYEKSLSDVPLFSEGQYKKAVQFLIKITVDDFSVISNYLSFFEVLAVLHNNKSVEFKDLNDLFYYRFSLAVNCGIIRKLISMKNLVGIITKT